MFKITEEQKEFTPKQLQAIDALYDEAMTEVDTLHKMWDDDNVRKEMEWFMDEILEEKFEVVLATSPEQAQMIAEEEMKEGKFYEPLNYPWMSDRSFVKYYKFGTMVEGLYDGETDTVKLLFRYEQFLNSGIFYVVATTTQKLIVVKPFIEKRVTAEGDLHCETAPALAWADGYEEYALHGIILDKDIWEKIVNHTMTFKEIMIIQDIDIKALAMKYIPGSVFLKETKAELIDGKTDRGNELWKVPPIKDVFENDEYFLHYWCPSSGREYLEGVAPEWIKEFGLKADALMARRHRLTLEEYLNDHYVST